MLVLRVIHGFWQLVGAPWRRVRHFRRSRHYPRARPEFPAVNARAGVEPVRPELSGLGIRRVILPRRVTRLLIQLAYRWHPSGEYRRRQREMRLMNQALRQKRAKLEIPPPVLSYPEVGDVAPIRFQPMIDGGTEEGPLSELPRDLTDLEEVERLRRPPMIQPSFTVVDPDYLVSYRPLLPRQYRRFLRTSPYPRAAVALVAVVAALGGFLWFSQLQQEQAVAAGRARIVRHTFEAQLLAARAYGLDAASVRLLAARASAVRNLPQPGGIVPSRARVAFYRDQARAYAALLDRLRALERRSLQIWIEREQNTYSSLAEATAQVNELGLGLAVPTIPACSTPACYQAAVRRQHMRRQWIHETAGTLRRYAAAVATTSDPASAAGTSVQEVHNLAALVPSAHPPVAVARLDSLYVGAPDVAGYARVGALARLDRDEFIVGLTRSFTSQTVVISIESGTLVCYQHGKAVIRTAVTAASGVPTGRFQIEDKRFSIRALYWNRSGRYTRYRYGSIPDWMPFSGGGALQAAPWRTAFGPGTDDAVTRYAPSTPGSIDLPVRAGSRVFNWVQIGTQVMVY